MTAASYCRELETYLCQKNGGHLVRIVGPAFEQVCSWAERGIPLKVALRGIDRCVARHQAKGTPRRPVRIEFCEADILDAFDEWRRAIGVRGVAGTDEETPEATARKPPLGAHVDRVMARLRTAARVPERSPAFVERLDSMLREMDAFLPVPKTRGDRRSHIVARLAALDAELLSAALDELPPARAGGLEREAEAELAPFGARLAPDARAQALKSVFHRLVREALGLPTIGYE